MTLPSLRLNSRLLDGVNSSSFSPSPSSSIVSIDSDFVVILAALLCALICVLGLVAVARCAWIRRISDTAPAPPPAAATPTAATSKGLKKKALNSLPKLAYSPDRHSGVDDCAICLAEFATGDEIRILPRCSHGFHVGCIDTWLGSHSSCPSCRMQILVAANRCDRCGDTPSAAAASSSSAPATTRTRREDAHIDDFLP